MFLTDHVTYEKRPARADEHARATPSRALHPMCLVDQYAHMCTASGFPRLHHIMVFAMILWRHDILKVGTSFSRSLKSHLAISHKDHALEITPCDFTQRNYARRSEPGAIFCLVPVTTVKMYIAARASTVHAGATNMASTAEHMRGHRRRDFRQAATTSGEAKRLS